MGCVASKIEEEVVSICKERKSQLKIAVERRYALAEAHCKYFHSLYAVAAAINLFVACHSSPPSSFLITLPPPCSEPPETENVINNPMFLQQTPFEPKHEAITSDSGASSTASESESSEEERKEKREREHQIMRGEEPAEQPFGYYYMQMPPSMPSPQRDFGWDFFNPFEGMRTEVISGYRQNSDDDLRVVREEEGIPELEEEGERDDFERQKVATVEENEGVAEHVSGNVETVNVASMATESENQREQRGLAVIDTPEEGRELLEALKDIEDYFVRAYNSGKSVTRMLEANRIPLQSGLEEIKGGS